VLAAVAAAAPAAAQPAVRPVTSITGTVRFEARATVGDFAGQSSALSGAVTGGPDLETLRGWVEAPVDSLRTGNGLRDRDMRRSLGSARFPALRFDLDEVRPSPAQGDSMVVTLAGRFTIHGVTRPVSIPALLAWRPGGIRLAVMIPMDVRDYGIEGLSRLLGVLRMDPEIIVRIDLLLGQPGA